MAQKTTCLKINRQKNSWRSPYHRGIFLQITAFEAKWVFRTKSTLSSQCGHKLRTHGTNKAHFYDARSTTVWPFAIYIAEKDLLQQPFSAMVNSLFTDFWWWPKHTTRRRAVDPIYDLFGFIQCSNVPHCKCGLLLPALPTYTGSSHNSATLCSHNSAKPKSWYVVIIPPPLQRLL
jgi:hypothetical protein